MNKSKSERVTSKYNRSKASSIQILFQTQDCIESMVHKPDMCTEVKKKQKNSLNACFSIYMQNKN